MKGKAPDFWQLKVFTVSFKDASGKRQYIAAEAPAAGLMICNTLQPTERKRRGNRSKAR